MDIVSYILSTTFTKKSLVGMGALKGAPCTISNISDNPDGTHDITFSWKDNNNVTHTSVLTVKDGQTPSIASVPITNGHRVTFATTNPSQSVTFDVMNGNNGQQGISVVGSNVDTYNHLTFTLSNGNTIDAGYINAVTNVDNVLSHVSTNPVENKVITDALDTKVDKEAGKGLFSDEEKAKLANIEDGAQVNVLEKLIINGQEATITDKSIALTLITSAVSNLQNYYLKTETYTKQEVEDLIGSTVGVTIEIVEQLPTEGQSNVIYFLPTETEGVYSQYIYSNNSWILIGSTTVDLSNYYTKAQVDTLLNGKQNVLTIDSFPTPLSNNPVASGGVYTAIAQMQPQFQFANMPTASSTNLGFVYQYTGATGTYTQNMFYRCIYDDTLGEYRWEEVIFHATVTVDSAISGTSTNPVQNKVIKEALDKKQNVMQYSTLPNAQDNLGAIVQYMGVTTSDYTNGFFYKSIYDTESASYIWVLVEFAANITVDSALSTTSENPVQNKAITNKIGEIEDLIPSEASSTNQLVDRDSLGTASQKNFTPYVSPNDGGVPLSSSVYSAITSAVYGAYHPSGSKTIAELTSDLLVLANIGNVYKITEDGVTTNLFIGGAGQTIHTGDNAVVVYGGTPNTFLFDLQSGSIDLEPYQTKALESAVEGQTTVEGALGALSTNKALKTDITYKNKSLTTTSVDDFGATLVANGVGSYSGTVSVNGTWYNYQSTIQGDLSGSWYGNAILWGDSGDFYTFRKSYSTSTTWIQKKFVTDEIVPSNASASNKLLSYKSTQLYANYQNDNTRVIRIEYPSQLATRLHLITEPGSALRDVFIQLATRLPFVTVYDIGASSLFTIKTADVSNKRVIYINVETSDGSVIVNQDDIPTDGYGNLLLPIVTVTNTSDEEWTNATAITPQKLVKESDLTDTVIKGKHYHGYVNGSTVTINISQLNINLYNTFEVTIRALYAEAGSVSDVKYIYNANTLATPAIAHTVYNVTNVVPTVTFANDGSKLTSITITANGKLNTIDVNVSL